MDWGSPFLKNQLSIFVNNNLLYDYNLFFLFSLYKHTSLTEEQFYDLLDLRETYQGYDFLDFVKSLDLNLKYNVNFLSQDDQLKLNLLLDEYWVRYYDCQDKVKLRFPCTLDRTNAFLIKAIGGYLKISGAVKEFYLSDFIVLKPLIKSTSEEEFLKIVFIIVYLIKSKKKFTNSDFISLFYFVWYNNFDLEKVEDKLSKALKFLYKCYYLNFLLKSNICKKTKPGDKLYKKGLRWVRTTYWSVGPRIENQLEGLVISSHELQYVSKDYDNLSKINILHPSRFNWNSLEKIPIKIDFFYIDVLLKEFSKKERKLKNFIDWDWTFSQEDEKTYLIFLKNSLLCFKKEFQDSNEVYFKYFNDFRGRVYPCSFPIRWQGEKLFQPIFSLREKEDYKNPVAELYIKKFMQDKFPSERREQFFNLSSDIFLEEVNSYDKEAKWELIWIYFHKKLYPIVSLDATTRGFQHFSCLFKIDSIKKLTGLLPFDLTDLPVDLLGENKDLYTAVTNIVWFLLNKDKNIPKISKVLSLFEKEGFNLSRKSFKQAIMVTIYGTGQKELANYISKEIVISNIESRDKGSLSFLLLRYIFKALNDLTDIDVVGLIGLFNKALVTSKKTKLLLPDGFVYERAYLIKEGLTISYGSEKVYLKLERNFTFDKKKSETAGLVNLIHAFDAYWLHNFYSIYNKNFKNLGFLPIHDCISVPGYKAKEAHSAALEVYRQMYNGTFQLEHILFEILRFSDHNNPFILDLLGKLKNKRSKVSNQDHCFTEKFLKGKSLLVMD